METNRASQETEIDGSRAELMLKRIIRLEKTNSKVKKKSEAEIKREIKSIIKEEAEARAY